MIFEVLRDERFVATWGGRPNVSACRTYMCSTRGLTRLEWQAKHAPFDSVFYGRLLILWVVHINPKAGNRSEGKDCLDVKLLQ